MSIVKPRWAAASNMESNLSLSLNSLPFRRKYVDSVHHLSHMSLVRLVGLAEWSSRPPMAEFTKSKA